MKTYTEDTRYVRGKLGDTWQNLGRVCTCVKYMDRVDGSHEWRAYAYCDNCDGYGLTPIFWSELWSDNGWKHPLGHSNLP